MDRLTIPDIRIDEHTTRRTVIDGNAVRENAMESYWRLKKIEDLLGDEYDLDYLRELVQAEQNEEANTAPKFVWHIGETQGVHRVPYRKSLEKYLGIKFWLTREEAEAALKGGA